ncbi:MAG: (Glutamate--ammonia-ligase) adenylyltransferase [Proteobacteria bacterium]|nr:(Glutamate--ammonia-ligase) adenylyltransferase [Pseudomonadota bacterium]
MTEFAECLNRLPEPLQPEVAGYWEAFEAAAQAAGVNLPGDPALESLIAVWAGSEFVARACIREPALLADLLASGDLASCYPPDGYATRLARALAEAADEDRLGVALRRFRRREMVRIAWRDLAGQAGLEETLGDLTDLAECLVGAALEQLHGWQVRRFGEPRDAEGSPQRLVVIGMGKLGGRELNFSSDIDLIFTYPRQGQTDGAKTVSNEEFWTGCGPSFTAAIWITARSSPCAR